MNIKRVGDEVTSLKYSGGVRAPCRLLPVLMLVAFCASAGTFHCRWNFTAPNGSALGVKEFKLQIIAPYGVGAETNIITGDYLNRPVNNQSYIIVSNLYNGRSYRAIFKGQDFTLTITNSFSTNVTGLVNATDYLTILTNADPAFVAYSQQGADARFHNVTGDTSSNAAFIGPLKFPNGATSGYVWTATNSDGSGAWVAAASSANATTNNGTLTSDLLKGDGGRGVVNATPGTDYLTPAGTNGFASTTDVQNATNSLAHTNLVPGQITLERWNGTISNFWGASAILTAQGTAVSGDTIYVGASSNSIGENALGKNGVNWQFAPGAFVYGNRQIWGDRTNGAMKFHVGGSGRFWSLGQNESPVITFTNSGSAVVIEGLQATNTTYVGVFCGDANMIIRMKDSIVSLVYDAIWNGSGALGNTGVLQVTAPFLLGGNNAVETDGGLTIVNADGMVGGMDAAAPTLNLIGGTCILNCSYVYQTNGTTAAVLGTSGNQTVTNILNVREFTSGAISFVSGWASLNNSHISGNVGMSNVSPTNQLVLVNCRIDSGPAINTAIFHKYPVIVGSLSYFPGNEPSANAHLGTPYTQRYFGDGQNLTNLNADYLASGTIGLARYGAAGLSNSVNGLEFVGSGGNRTNVWADSLTLNSTFTAGGGFFHVYANGQMDAGNATAFIDGTGLGVWNGGKLGFVSGASGVPGATFDAYFTRVAASSLAANGNLFANQAGMSNSVNGLEFVGQGGNRTNVFANSLTLNGGITNSGNIYIGSGGVGGKMLSNSVNDLVIGDVAGNPTNINIRNFAAASGTNSGSFRSGVLEATGQSTHGGATFLAGAVTASNTVTVAGGVNSMTVHGIATGQSWAATNHSITGVNQANFPTNLIPAFVSGQTNVGLVVWRGIPRFVATNGAVSGWMTYTNWSNGQAGWAPFVP